MADQTLLPTNATAWERANSTVSSRLLAAPVALILQERDPVNCGAKFVAALAWERSVHFWSATDTAGNRARVASSFADHCAYGTPAALEAEIALDTGQNVRIVEFFEDPSLVWPQFAVSSVIHPGDPLPDMDALMASALRRKNVRDWPLPRVHAIQPGAAEYVGAACGVTVTAWLPVALPVPPQSCLGAAIGVTVTAHILPNGGSA